MTRYPPEWETMEEEEQPVTEADYQPPQPAPRQQTPPARLRQAPSGRGSGGGLSKLALAISIVALIVSWMTYEAEGKRGRTGIDVSAYQKEIDWPAVAADGIDFAILRLGYRGYTEGGLFLDKTFEQNLQGALNAGLDVGVYFFSQAVTPEEAEQEADYVCSALDGYDITYPVAFDWEPISDESARTNGLDGETLTQCADAFCARVKEAGYTPAVYFNQSLGYLRYDLRELTDYALWLAEYDSKPDFYYHFDLWQYTHTGQVAGIEGNVDLDLDLR